MISSSMERPAAAQEGARPVFAAGVPGWLALPPGFLTAVGPISTDIYMPASPAMEQSFQNTAGQVQFTMANCFFLSYTSAAADEQQGVSPVA